MTFENVQAGLRTDYLFRLANQHGGIVLGTGDLSELALGWCTYGVGDQMSHYNVNAGVPKTLIQHLIRWVIAPGSSRRGRADAAAILATEISPELVPVEAGETPQSTEAKIGPYALQDFNLFYTLRYGFRPSKIAFLALHAWGDAARRLAAGFPEERRRLRPAGDPALAAGVPAALLRLQPVQALGDAERAQGVGGRLAVPARRLAGAVGRQRPHLARRVGPQRAFRLNGARVVDRTGAGARPHGGAWRPMSRAQPCGGFQPSLRDRSRPRCGPRPWPGRAPHPPRP